MLKKEGVKIGSFLLKKQGRKPSARPHASYGVYSISANALLLEKVTKLFRVFSGIIVVCTYNER